MLRALLLGCLCLVLLSAFVPPSQPERQTLQPPQPYTRTLHFKRRVDTFNQPNRLATDSDGNLYISDLADHKVYVYDRNFAYVRAFGTGEAGNGVGDLAAPEGLAVLNGFLFVADSQNNRVSYFALSGTTVGYLLNNGALNFPKGLAATPDGNLIVVSQGNHRVVKFSTAGNIYFALGGLGNGIGQFNMPTAVAVDAQGNVFITDTGNKRIQKFDPAGRFIRQFGERMLAPAQAIAIDRAGALLVADTTGRWLTRFDGRGSDIEGYDVGGLRDENRDPLPLTDIAILNVKNLPPYVIVSDGNGEVNVYENAARPALITEQSQFVAGSAIKGMTFDEGGNLYVIDAGRVLNFDRFGVLIKAWEFPFKAPAAIAADHAGNLYVVDANVIKVFDGAGNLLRAWDGASAGGFGNLAGIAVDGNLFVYLTDLVRNRIYKYTTVGELVRSWEAEAPVALAVDTARGAFYLASNTGRLVELFDTYGKYYRKFANGQVIEKYALVSDGRGAIYVSYGEWLSRFGFDGSWNTTLSGKKYTALAIDPTSGQLYAAEANGQITRFGMPDQRPETPALWHPSTQTFTFQSGVEDVPNLDVTVLGANENDIPLVGDWDGDGIDTVGLYRPSTSFFYLWDSLTNLSMGTPHTLALLGNPGDQPLAGDWNGDGIDGIGAYRPSNGLIYLQNVPGKGTPDFIMVFGSGNDIGLAGDWNGDGQDTIGTYRRGERRFYLTDRNVDGPLLSDYTIDLGNPGDLPFVGDWSGTGVSGVGVFRPSTGYFYLKEKRDTSQPEYILAFGRAGDVPLSGAWGTLPVPDLPLPDAVQPILPPLILLQTPTPTVTPR
jgi:DNA-binding beta-propeller fold protein YncE